MPMLNWVGKNSDKDPINVQENRKNIQLVEINHNPNIDKYDFVQKFNYQKDNSLFDLKSSQNWYNLLFIGDNLQILTYLVREYLKKINLIYIDPPFATGSNFKYKIVVGEEGASEILESYSDNWSNDIDEYISFMYDRLNLMKLLLSDNGSIYVHLDWHISHYIKVILDEIFGKENFRNEIIWAYPAASVKTRRFFIRSFDSILFYTKSENYTFNDDPSIYMEYSNRVKDNLKQDEKGKFYYRGGSHGGKKLSQKVYLQEEGIFPRDVWNDIPYVRANTSEYQGFSTQKPERLLKRIILASSNPGDLIADFFCGTGTTVCVAEKLNRKWIGADNRRNAINITRKRLFDIYSSNNLYSWKSKFKKMAKPFKIIRFGDNREDFTIPVNLINQEITNDLSIQNSKLQFTVSINTKKHYADIELTNYSIPKSELLHTDLLNKIVDFSDWIDSWAVDYNFKENEFNTTWVSFRTFKKKKLSLRSKPYPYEKKGEYKVAVKVINIFGGESVQSYKVIIN